MPFDAVLELSSLDGTTGFQINGEAASDDSGWSVASAGDINGDGIDDLIIGARGADPNGSFSGASYVVFGRTTGFAATLNLSTLDGTTGFQISGVAASDQSGISVASAGDVNGDGIDDLIIGAKYADPNGSASGASYVVFGRTTGFAAELNPSTLDGTTGFQINGEATTDLSGVSVASAGDVNGDGIGDLIIGAMVADPNGASSGASYVVFGRTTGFAATLELSGLNGTTGFQINGEVANDQSGASVASAGDINGDGVDDLIIGAKYADPNGSSSGASYVVFGRTTGFAAELNLSTLDGTTGFQINGEVASDQSGISVASAGDINGDGIDDLIIGARLADPNGFSSGAGYVVFGRTTGFAAELNLSTLDGTNGFQINGEVAGDRAGVSVASAGDINGDGIDDLVIGAYTADPKGSNSGASYVVFGRTTGFAAVLELSTLDGTNGFQINGKASGDFSGWSVASAGDVNGDGVDDLIIGAYGADPNGSGSGASYVIFGRASSVSFAGTSGDDVRSGGAMADSLSGQGGNDTLNGLDGDDLLDGGDLSDVLNGGNGADDLIGGGGGDILNGDDGADELNGGDGADKLFGGTGTDLLNGGTGNDRMDGQSDVDTLNGGVGNDYLDGGLGADVMSGGADNDIYIVDDASDQTIELAGEGYDIVRTAMDGWVLSENIEALQLQGSADIDGSGNAGANNLQGNTGANSLDGGAGSDTINGNDGDDFIIGGLGNDLLRGGTGADTFVVRQESIANLVLETDQVYDFDAQDLIDLSAIDANTRLDGNQAFRLVSAFTKPDAAHDADVGQMTLTFAGGITTLRLDVNGDGKVDYQMKINGDVTGDSGDWLL
ncbi:hypothetical protein [Caulobacter sp. NIBR1757]|uniref:beta strand repeat-containing protein n=1 Tax=Caulobacter sp. NIBR1757 TaxID=3016000 RepID=UPI0022EFED97|nr:hypothetical protein [Caulobacter sp. NIBR1757]WGM38577.1 hypothetical protein AMEJIAPC_01480 [Caulobacter sp. NIBR1757]